MMSSCHNIKDMGICISLILPKRFNQVSKEEAENEGEEYVERITHITADIHDKIRRKNTNKTIMKILVKGMKKALTS